MAKSKKPSSTDTAKALLEIQTGSVPDVISPLSSLQEAMKSSGLLSTIETLNKHQGILQIAREQQELADRLKSIMPTTAYFTQIAQIKERLGIFDTIERMRAIGVQPNVIESINELQKRIGTIPLDPNPFGRFNFAALSALTDHKREFYAATSLKFTAIETASLMRGFDSSAYAAARTSLLGSWHSRPDLPSRFFSESEYRTGIYREHDVDEGLIDAPPEVAVELMIESGFLPADPDQEEAVARLAVGSVSMEIRSADPTSSAKEVLDHIEQRLRAAIADKMRGVFGEQWFKHCAPPDVLQNARRKREASRKSGEPIGPLVQWTDLGDLHKIIVSKGNWQAAFEELFAERDRFDADMRSLITFRRPVAHVRPIDSPRLAELLLIAQRIERWIVEDGLWKKEASSEE